jgi:hypothetical protein
MIPRSLAVLACAVACSSAGAGPRPTDSPRPSAGGVIGCYTADRPLGEQRYPEAGLSSVGLASFRLLPGGGVARPTLPTADRQQRWASASKWWLSDDTLVVRLSTGLAGWKMVLREVEGVGTGRFVGSALYLTDGRVSQSSAAPEITARKVSVSVKRVSCPPRLDQAR